MHQLIEKALYHFFSQFKLLSIEKVLHLESWNKDLHFKISVDNKLYSIRFVRYNRSSNQVFGEITDDVLKEQLKFTKFLVQQGIPFMEHVPSVNGDSFVSIGWKGILYRVVLFKWIEGEHITKITKNNAELVGNVVKKIHSVSSEYESVVLPKESHLYAYSKFIGQIKQKQEVIHISTEILEKLNSYLQIDEYHVTLAKKNNFEYIVQSDLNPLNLLWDQENRLMGIVDFESIGYTDRVEGLAWLIKWYSRTEGIGSVPMSPTLAQTFIGAYSSRTIFPTEDFERLRSLLWLSGCMNWNFVKKTLEIMELGDQSSMVEHISFYKDRGEKLISLI